MIKVLLINPSFGGQVGQGGKSAPLNLAYLASYVGDVADVSIMDCENLGLDMQDIKYKVFFERPDIIGITMPTPVADKVFGIAKMIKDISQETIIVVGGPHPTAFPQETSCYPFDLAVYGEGEETFKQIVNVVKEGKPLDGINGTAYNGKVNPPQPLIENLDTIPFPARDLLPLDKYVAPPTKRESNYLNANMITSRGCPYVCKFCMNRIIWDKKVRFRSIGNVVKEIEECVYKYNRREFNFHDELFTANRNRVLEFCKEVQDKKLDIVWICTIRVDHIWLDVLREMKKSGCRKIMFGFESGSQKILDNINKKTTLSQAIDAVTMVKSVGIKTSGSFMIGNLGETEETIKETIDFAKRLNVDTATFYVASPYPGTEFWEIAERDGLLRGGLRWRDLAPISDTEPPVNLPGLPSNRISYWYKRAYREYYKRPMFILQRIFNIRRLNDVNNLLEGLKIYKGIQNA